VWPHDARINLPGSAFFSLTPGFRVGNPHLLRFCFHAVSVFKPVVQLAVYAESIQNATSLHQSLFHSNLLPVCISGVTKGLVNFFFSLKAGFQRNCSFDEKRNLFLKKH